jgi:predicted PurR-regulated permease PerM
MVRDEREQMIDAQAERLTAAILSFGILVLVLARSLRGEAAWDLLALVIAAGFAGTLYRLRNRAVGRQWATMTIVTAAVAAVIAIAIVVATAR